MFSRTPNEIEEFSEKTIAFSVLVDSHTRITGHLLYVSIVIKIYGSSVMFLLGDF